jgi:hypothetical protein
MDIKARLAGRARSEQADLAWPFKELQDICEYRVDAAPPVHPASI